MAQTVAGEGFSQGGVPSLPRGPGEDLSHLAGLGCPVPSMRSVRSSPLSLGGGSRLPTDVRAHSAWTSWKQVRCSGC